MIDKTKARADARNLFSAIYKVANELGRTDLAARADCYLSMIADDERRQPEDGMVNITPEGHTIH